MAEIRHKLAITAIPEKVYEAVTTQEGLAGWWAKQTIAKPEVGFVNVFTFGTSRSDMKVTQLDPGKKAEWQCIDAIEEWKNTGISFDLEEKDGRTILRFAHSGWRATTDLFAECNYAWGRFMTSLKSYCETGAGTPA